MRKPIPKQLKWLIYYMRLLNEIIEDPRKGGSLALIRKIRGESKVPTNEILRDFRDEIEDDYIKKATNRIKSKLGFRLPDGLK